MSLPVATFVLFQIYSLPFATSWIYILPTPKLMTLLNSVYALYPLLKLICYNAFIQSCLFGRSLQTRLAGRIINHFCTRYAIFLCSFQYCHLLKWYVTCAALRRTFIPQSFWNTRCGRPRGRKFHLTRSLVVLEGWSSVKDRTNRKHCPSHEIGSYKRDGRWWGWSFDSGSSTVLLYLPSRCVYAVR